MPPTPRRRRGRLASLLPALLVVTALCTSAAVGVGNGDDGIAQNRIVDLRVTTPGAPLGR